MIGDKYDQKEMEAVVSTAVDTWTKTYGEDLGCDLSAPSKASDTPEGWRYYSCGDPSQFVERLPRSFEWCGCKKSPVSITNQVTCFTKDGQYACGNF